MCCHFHQSSTWKSYENSERRILICIRFAANHPVSAERCSNVVCGNREPKYQFMLEIAGTRSAAERAEGKFNLNSNIVWVLRRSDRFRSCCLCPESLFWIVSVTRVVYLLSPHFTRFAWTWKRNRFRWINGIRKRKQQRAGRIYQSLSNSHFAQMDTIQSTQCKFKLVSFEFRLFLFEMRESLPDSVLSKPSPAAMMSWTFPNSSANVPSSIKWAKCCGEPSSFSIFATQGKCVILKKSRQIDNDHIFPRTYVSSFAHFGLESRLTETGKCELPKDKEKYRLNGIEIETGWP